jgi:Na+/melibiose symporter-like transporter
MNSAPPAPGTTVVSSEQPDRFKVGTLAYTKAGMITVFLFLLWGDFCFTLMETVVPTLMPLKFNAIGAPNWVLGLVMSTIPNIMTAGINPLISVRSDRFRSKWGRRIPFLAGATPFLVLFLVLLGCADGIGAWVHGSILGGRFSETTVLIVTISVLLVCFQFFNLFITSVYYYLFNDVVPQAYLARFMALFRVVGSFAGIGYNLFVLKHAKTHLNEIFIGAGLLYFVAFMMMCWKVKEGNYPPPPAFEGAKPGFRAALRSYAVECFSNRFYWLFFLANSCVAMTWASGTFTLIYQTQYLGLSLDFIGKVAAVCGGISMVLLYPAGMLADRARPITVLLISTCLQALMGPVIIAFAMMRPSMEMDTVLLFYVGVSALSLPINTLYYASELPTLMTLFPKSRYGQFCSANALVRSVALIIGGLACGMFLDAVKTLNPNPDYCYRFLPVWNFFFQTCSAVLLFFLYREWKKLGGKDHFKPPINAATAE